MGGRGGLEKPASVAADEFKSHKWDELTAGRDFTVAEVPALSLLVQWYAVAQRCIDDIDDLGGQVAYQNDLGDLKALPQLSTMKQASAEIRALNAQLGINDEVEEPEPERKETKLYVIQANRENREANASRTG